MDNLTEKLVTVNISDMKITSTPDTLVTYALGSCIGICLWDPMKKNGALGHIMLPYSTIDDGAELKKFRYADTCVPIMIDEMLKKGSKKFNLVAKIAGGAHLFNLINSGSPSAANMDFNLIGDKNVVAVKKALMAQRIVLVAEDTGEDYARTIYFNTEDGKVTVKSANRQINVL